MRGGCGCCCGSLGGTYWLPLRSVATSFASCWKRCHTRLSALSASLAPIADDGAARVGDPVPLVGGDRCGLDERSIDRRNQEAGTLEVGPLLKDVGDDGDAGVVDRGERERRLGGDLGEQPCSSRGGCRHHHCVDADHLDIGRRPDRKLPTITRARDRTHRRIKTHLDLGAHRRGQLTNATDQPGEHRT